MGQSPAPTCVLESKMAAEIHAVEILAAPSCASVAVGQCTWASCPGESAVPDQATLASTPAPLPSPAGSTASLALPPLTLPPLTPLPLTPLPLTLLLPLTLPPPQPLPLTPIRTPPLVCPSKMHHFFAVYQLLSALWSGCCRQKFTT